ncbi:MAG TPA: YfhO family protein, partial [Gemmataceae bacterium]|nr:YfhO family protein [Gemmataceae bacterium]
ILHNIYPNYQGVIAHLPWLLWLMDLASATNSAPRRRLALSILALLTGSQLLLGAPQALSFSLFAEALFAVFLVWHRRPRWTFWASWIAANLLGVLIGAVQLLATRALLANSTRDHFDPMIGSLMPSQLLQLLAPNLLSRHLPRFACSEPLYFGAVPLILGLWWLTIRYPLSAIRYRTDGGLRIADSGKRLGLFAIILGVLAGWLALGDNGYLYCLQTRLPLVGQFRLPGRYFTLVAFAASILTAIAFDHLLTGIRAGWKASWRQLALPWAVVGVALALAIAFRFAYPKENGSSIHRNYFAGPLFLCGAAAALTLAARGRMVGLFALLALTVVDLEVFSVQAPFWRESLWRGLPTLTEFAERAESPPRPREGRWLDDAFEMPHPAFFGQPVLQGYHGGLEPMKRLNYRTLAALRVSHTAWQHLSRFDKPNPVLGLRRVDELWYEVPDPLPRLYLVSRAQVSENPAADIQRIDLKTTALVTHPIEVEAGEVGSAALLHEQPGELRLRVEAPGRRLLVIAESYDPNWRLTVDDKPMTVERVNGDFLGCVVEAGEHDVRFVFRPPSVLYGRLLSRIGFGIVLLIAGVSCFQMLIRSRRAAGARPPLRSCE